MAAWPLTLLVWHLVSSAHHTAAPPAPPPFAVGDCLAMAPVAGNFLVDFGHQETKVGCADPTASYVVEQQINGPADLLPAGGGTLCAPGETELGVVQGGRQFVYCLVPKR